MIAAQLLLGCATLLLSIAYVNSIAFGDFFIKIEEVKPIPGITKEYINWSLKMRRIARYEQVMIGHIEFKKRCGPIEARMKVEQKCDGGYKPLKVGKEEFGKICDSAIISNFFSRYNMTLPSDCIFEPQTAYLRPTDMHKTLHDKMPVAEYGRFRATLTYTVLNKPVMGYQILVLVEKKR